MPNDNLVSLRKFFLVQNRTSRSGAFSGTKKWKGFEKPDFTSYFERHHSPNGITEIKPLFISGFYYLLIFCCAYQQLISSRTAHESNGVGVLHSTKYQGHVLRNN